LALKFARMDLPVQELPRPQALSFKITKHSSALSNLQTCKQQQQSMFVLVTKSTEIKQYQY